MKRNLTFFMAMLFILPLFSCGKKEYKVDYEGFKESYIDAKDAYPEGAKVKIKHPIIYDATTKFFLDEEELNVYGKDGYYIIEFTMPASDVILSTTSVGDMTVNE